MSSNPAGRDRLLALVVLQGAVVVAYVPYLAADYATGLLDVLARGVALVSFLVTVGFLVHASRSSDAVGRVE